MLAIIVSLILIVVLLVGVIMGGVKVNITKPDNDESITTRELDFILLGNFYIQIIYIQSIEVIHDKRSILILTDCHRYLHSYPNDEKFYEALNDFDFILGTNLSDHDGIQTCNESSRN